MCPEVKHFVWSIIRAGRRSFTRTDRRNYLKKVETLQAQGLGVVPWEQSFFHWNKRNGMERNDYMWNTPSPKYRLY